MKIIKIPDDGIVREYIYEGKDTVVGERCIDLNDYPTVDAIEVVRCKDCKWRNDRTMCPMYDWWTTEGIDEFFCKFGEKTK